MLSQPVATPVSSLCSGSVTSVDSGNTPEVYRVFKRVHSVASEYTQITDYVFVNNFKLFKFYCSQGLNVALNYK
jgi:hypothetical protein